MIALPNDKRKLKCLVCNAVFEAGPDRCPVCGAGLVQCVPIEEAASKYEKNSDERFVILGGGTAAVQAAKAVRERNKTAEIWMIYDEDGLPYNRPMLTKEMLTGLGSDRMAIFDRDWYADNEIRRLDGVTVTELDTEQKRVFFGEGEVISFDRCIYALGSRSFVPPALDIADARVCTVRNQRDRVRIKKMVDGGAKNAVVVGGGVLGLETAWELCKAGCAVRVIDNNPQLLARKIAPQASEALLQTATEKGIEILLSNGVAAIEAESGDLQVLLNDGRKIQADLVVVSAGVRPNAEIAKQAGIAVDRAIIVDSAMRTNVADIYACGDCAQLNGVNYCLWSEATGQGKIAGATAAGDSAAYTTELPAVTLNVLGMPLYALGDNGSNSERMYQTVLLEKPETKALEVYYFLDEKLCGATLLGDLRKMKAVIDGVQKSLLRSEMFP